MDSKDFELLVADKAEIGILIPTLKLRSEPVGKMTDLFLRDFGIFEAASSNLTSRLLDAAN